MFKFRLNLARGRGFGAGLAVLAMLAACAPAPAPLDLNDPDEAKNREIHAFNSALDTAFLRPAGIALTEVLPQPMLRGVSNFAANLDLPGAVLNDVLQLRLGRAVENTLRFAINTTIGVGGLMDPASALGVLGDPTDFGETLHVWGVAEGAYGELPLLGPTTDRDALGTMVDLALNPLRLIVPQDLGWVPLSAEALSLVADRGRYLETFDSILYDSADSYAQARLLYLQNRRFELGIAAAEAYDDPYEDPYAQ